MDTWVGIQNGLKLYLDARIRGCGHTHTRTWRSWLDLLKKGRLVASLHTGTCTRSVRVPDVNRHFFNQYCPLDRSVIHKVLPAHLIMHAVVGTVYLVLGISTPSCQWTYITASTQCRHCLSTVQWHPRRIRIRRFLPGHWKPGSKVTINWGVHIARGCLNTPHSRAIKAANLMVRHSHHLHKTLQMPM